MIVGDRVRQDRADVSFHLQFGEVVAAGPAAVDDGDRHARLVRLLYEAEP
jgi:hypothetical protein